MKKELQLTEYDNYVAISPLSRGVELEKLSPRIYYFQQTDAGPIFIKGPERFVEPEILFGTDITRRTIAVGRKWKETKHALGVMAIGNKGSGKTQLLNHIANKAMDAENIPCFHIKGKLPAEVLEFISNKIGDAIFLFDEYGKYYCTDIDSHGNTRPSDELLQFMSEKSKNRRLIMLAENNSYKVSEFIMDRPGRIHFRFNLSTCTESEMEDIITKFGLEEPAASLIRSGRSRWSVDDARTAAAEVRELCLAMPDTNRTALLKALKEAISDINIPALATTLVRVHLEAQGQVGFYTETLPDPNNMLKYTLKLGNVYIDGNPYPDIIVEIPNVIEAMESGAEIFKNDAVKLTMLKTSVSKESFTFAAFNVMCVNVARKIMGLNGKEVSRGIPSLDEDN